MAFELNWKGLLRVAFPSFLFYGLAIAFLTWLDKVSPSGPCNPGLGFIAFLLFVPVVAILLIKNLVIFLNGSKIHLISVAIHVIAVASGVGLFYH